MAYVCLLRELELLLQEWIQWDTSSVDVLESFVEATRFEGLMRYGIWMGITNLSAGEL